MATAVEPSSASSTPGKALALPIASLLGAIYVLATLAVAFFAVPVLWKTVVPGPDNTVALTLRIALQLAALGGLLWFGTKLAGESAPKGLRGGAFLIVVALLFIFLIARTFAANIDPPAGNIVGAAVAGLLLFFTLRFINGKGGERWSIGLEEQGWFSLAQYKKTLGVRVRRLTIVGILLVLGTGIYALSEGGSISNTLTTSVPFVAGPVTLLADAKILLPILLSALALWIAFRAVNIPEFAEFLIATEAEMNKVSWSTRKRLAQDTVVVLVTTLILTLFLLVVDLFWGWLLSLNQVGVLPSRATNTNKSLETQEQKW